jgi:hypothetical protein
MLLKLEVSVGITIEIFQVTYIVIASIIIAKESKDYGYCLDGYFDKKS